MLHSFAACRDSYQQYWFERFPAAGGAAATTYMFTFTDPSAANSTVMSHMLDKYLEQLPNYLGKRGLQICATIHCCLQCFAVVSVASRVWCCYYHLHVDLHQPTEN